MRPKNVTDIVILKLIFVPEHGKISPPVVENYQKILAPPSRLHPVQEWLNQVMVKEQSSIPNGNRVNYCMWQIISHDSELFTVYNMRFHTLVAVIGEEKIHWLFYILRPIYALFDGVTALTLNYCRCCFDKQYMKFVEIIHKDNQDPNCHLLS